MSNSHQRDAETTAMLHELGYTLDYDRLEKTAMILNGRPFTTRDRRFFESIAPYMVMAYQAGLAGESLTRTFPFLREIESAPAAGTAETQQEPEPHKSISFYHGDADGVKEV